MRSPEVILKNLGDKAKDNSYQFKRLYRNLYNPEMYLLAYQKIASSEGSMTAGTDGKTLDGMSMARVNRIIASLKDHITAINHSRPNESISQRKTAAKNDHWVFHPQTTSWCRR